MLRRLSMTDGGNEQLATVVVQVSGDFGQQLRGKSQLRMTSSVNWPPAYFSTWAACSLVSGRLITFSITPLASIRNVVRTVPQ